MRSKKNRQRAQELGLDIDNVEGFRDLDDLRAEVDPDPIEQELFGDEPPRGEDPQVPEAAGTGEQVEDIYTSPQDAGADEEYYDDDEEYDDEYDDEEYDEDYDDYDEDEPKRSKGKIILLIVILALLALIGYRIYDHFFADGADSDANAVTVKVAVASEGEIYVESPITAKVEAVQESAIVPVVAGKVTSVSYKEGDYVKKGATLFTIDDTQAKTQVEQAKAAMTQTETAVTQAKSAVEQAQTGVSQAKSMLDSAQADFTRYQTLYEEGAISQQQYESAQLQLTNAQAQYSNAQSQLVSAQAQVTSVQAQADSAKSAYQSAVESLDYYKVTAPISGYLTSFTATNGGVVGQAVVGNISDTSELVVNTTVSEALTSRINEGDIVDVYISSLKETVKGTVSTFTKVPAPNTVTYPITIKIKNPDADILAGMFVEVRVKTDYKAYAVKVPSDAVMIKNGEPIVVTIEEGLPVFNSVVTGIDNGEEVEIVSGIKKGDVVITSGQQYVQEGEEVNIAN